MSDTHRLPGFSISQVSTLAAGFVDDVQGGSSPSCHEPPGELSWALRRQRADSFLAYAQNGVSIVVGKLDLPAGTRRVVVGAVMALVLIVRPSGLTRGCESTLRRPPSAPSPDAA